MRSSTKQKSPQTDSLLAAAKDIDKTDRAVGKAVSANPKSDIVQEETENENPSQRSYPYPAYKFSQISLHEMLIAGIQTKLEVSSLDDEYEKEADAVADKVTQQPQSTDKTAGNISPVIISRLDPSVK